MDNPDVLKKAYMKALPIITIFKELTDNELEHLVEEKTEKKIVKVSKDFESALCDIRKELDEFRRSKNDSELKNGCKIVSWLVGKVKK